MIGCDAAMMVGCNRDAAAMAMRKCMRHWCCDDVSVRDTMLNMVTSTQYYRTIILWYHILKGSAGSANAQNASVLLPAPTCSWHHVTTHLLTSFRLQHQQQKGNQPAAETCAKKKAHHARTNQDQWRWEEGGMRKWKCVSKDVRWPVDIQRIHHMRQEANYKSSRW